MTTETGARHTQRADRGGTVRGLRRRGRLVPPAVTPVRPRDVVAGLASHRRGEGRDAFREGLADRLDAASAATYTSYRRALSACLQSIAADADGRDTVLVPAFCSSDYADAAEGAGLELDRYDVEPETLTPDEASLRNRLDEDVLAVVAVSVLGYAPPMERLVTTCADAGVTLVEALGYSVGSSYRGAPLGSFGDLAVLNFQQGKPIPVGGGMVVSQDEVSAFSDEGRPSAEPNLTAIAGYAAFGHPGLYFAYDVVSTRLARLDLLGDRVTTHPGSKLDVAYEPPFATVSNFQGAVGRRILARLDDHQRQRARTARFYARALEGCPHVDHVWAVDGLEGHQHVRYPLLVDGDDRRDALVDALREMGIQATVLYNWPRIDPGRFPGAASLQQRILTLPTHPYVDEADRRTVVDTVREVLTAEETP